MVRLYYDTEEGKFFDNVLGEKLNEELFDNLYLEFGVIEEKDVKYNGKIDRVIVEIKPLFVAFHRDGKYKKERLNLPINEKYEWRFKNERQKHT